MNRTFLICLFGLAATSAKADMFEPSHICNKPYKPFEFASQWELDSFNDEVRQYKQCIANFVDEQNEAVANHQRAAEQAIDEWNNFVNYELN
ncbi:MAG TPA: hypothetical protein DEB15_09020 [Pusillimonas sp.]|nr:hypothetical protein [Pusillimonas sp.]